MNCFLPFFVLLSVSSATAQAACRKNQFPCWDGSRCVSRGNICNGRKNCPDNSDERICPCAVGQIRCDNGECVDSGTRCTAIPSCPVGKFHCKKHGNCINGKYVCDGNNDCSDNSDEENCPCPASNFTCANYQCIAQDDVCNDVKDCLDNSDEIKCCAASEHYRCDNGDTCIPNTQLCDKQGSPDCPDGSDEKEQICCGAGKFRCLNGKCVSRGFVCDETDHCGDNSDEIRC